MRRRVYVCPRRKADVPIPEFAREFAVEASAARVTGVGTVNQVLSRAPQGVVPRFDGRQIHPLPAAATGRPNARTDARQAGASEILFVDPSVSDLGTILANLRPEVEAIVLDANRPAARQMALALEGRDGLDAVHVIAHGAPGRVNFAAGDWSAETLDEDADYFARSGSSGRMNFAADQWSNEFLENGGHAADLAAIGKPLAPHGSLQLWSCCVGEAERGRTFVRKLSLAIGATVAATDQHVGSVWLGGTWELESDPDFHPRAPVTPAGRDVYSHLLSGVYRTISGDVPHDPGETGNISCVVVSSKDKRVLATFLLPAETNIPTFSITVTVPSTAEALEAGRLDAQGKFIPAKFTISEPVSIGSTGEARYGA